jgi:hypothetical protein
VAITLTLRNGRKLFTYEPRIDDVVREVNAVQDKCGPIVFATE